MLVRCKTCGKPIHLAEWCSSVECGYCYERVSVDVSSPSLAPRDLDWRHPLLDGAADSEQIDAALAWLGFLGDYGDAPRRLEEMAREQARLAKEAEEVDAALRRVDELLSDGVGLRKINRFAPAIQELESLSSDDARIANAIEQLQKRHAELKDRISTRIISTIISAVLIVLLFLVTTNVYSCAIDQPRRLNEARILAQQKRYEEASEAYWSLYLLPAGTLRNVIVNDAALTGYCETKMAWGDELAEQGEWYDAARLYRTVADVGDSEEAERKYDAIGKEQYTEYVRRHAEEGDYQKALEAISDADEDELAASGITFRWLYEQWTADAIDRGDKEEVLAIANKLSWYSGNAWAQELAQELRKAAEDM